ALVVTVALFWSAIAFVPPGLLHADEAVQWSLAKELAEGSPYSTHQDKFHGPTLATAMLISAKLTGTAPMDMDEHYLRSIVSIFLGLMAASALILPGVGKGPRYVTAAFIVLTGGCTPFGYYFVQEMLLVCGFVWGVALWMRAEGSSPTSRWWVLSGAAFGFALACKVTAAAYLGLFLLALVWLRRGARDRRWLRFGFGLAASWACFQSVGFTDLDGLKTWWLQLARALGVASGQSEDTLLADSLAPWAWGAAWLAVFALARSGLSPARWRSRHEADLPCLVACLVFLFHLALPYKTPWLLLLVFSLPLALALPYLLAGGAGRMSALALGLALIAFAARSPLSSHSRTHDAGLGLFRDSVDRMAKAYGPKFYVAVEGGHYWPLPYYLRKHPVGFGEFPQAAKAPLRLIPAHDASVPMIPAYAVRELTLRTDGADRYWVLVAKAYESGFVTQK
ncbi:MAG: hypothetical protein EBR95_08245, partial [Verrucomicrobia bacterium]|nr:hypothetical protein [Verrucomicrobiota bacterium]